MWILSWPLFGKNSKEKTFFAEFYLGDQMSPLHTLLSVQGFVFFLFLYFYTSEQGDAQTREVSRCCHFTVCSQFADRRSAASHAHFDDTIPSLGQCLATIENQLNQWLPGQKTIGCRCPNFLLFSWDHGCACVQPSFKVWLQHLAVVLLSFYHTYPVLH